MCVVEKILMSMKTLTGHSFATLICLSLVLLLPQGVWSEEKPSGNVPAAEDPSSSLLGECTFCYHNGKKNSPGAVLCLEGKVYECLCNGSWNLLREEVCQTNSGRIKIEIDPGGSIVTPIPDEDLKLEKEEKKQETP